LSAYERMGPHDRLAHHRGFGDRAGQLRTHLWNG